MDSGRALLIATLSGMQAQQQAKQAAEQQKANNLIKMLQMGFMPVAPDVQRTQTAQQFLGGPMNVAPQKNQFMGVQPRTLPPLKAPITKPPAGAFNIPGVVQGQRYYKQYQKPRSEVFYESTKASKTKLTDKQKVEQWANTPTKKAKLANLRKNYPDITDKEIVKSLGL